MDAFAASCVSSDWQQQAPLSAKEASENTHVRSRIPAYLHSFKGSSHKLPTPFSGFMARRDSGSARILRLDNVFLPWSNSTKSLQFKVELKEERMSWIHG